MTHRTTLSSCAALRSRGRAGIAQNRVEQQLFLELRTLQAQVQQLTAAINAVNEHLAKTDTRVDAQANDDQGFADQKVLIDGIATNQRTLSEVQNEGSVRLLAAQSGDEGDSRRSRYAAVAAEPDPRAVAAAGAAPQPTDPNAPPAQTPPAAAKPGGSIPPSPGEYYNKAFDYFYKGMFAEAIEFLADAIKRFPDSPEAARAQFMIGDANLAMGGHDADALAAYALVIKNYKDPEVLPDAYLKQGDAYERLGQKENARKSYEDVRSKYPNSSAAVFALSSLKRMGYIK
jgi:tol-pal system protein YbgF